MKYFRFVWKNVFRKKSRAFLTIASIVLVLILIVILTALLEGMEGTTGTGKGATHIVVQHATGLTNFMPLAYRQRIEEIPSVVSVAPEIWFGGIYKDEKPENFFGQLSTDPSVWAVIHDDYQVPEDQLKTWQTERDSFIAGKQLIDKFGWKFGDRIQLKGTYITLTLDLVLRGVYTGPDESNIFFHNKYLENAVSRLSEQTGIFFLRTQTPEQVALVLSEAMVLAVLGGLFGIAIGVPITRALVTLMSHTPVAPFAYNVKISVTNLLNAFGASVAIGILAGFVPAIRSARVSIVDGLRQVV